MSQPFQYTYIAERPVCNRYGLTKKAEQLQPERLFLSVHINYTREYKGNNRLKTRSFQAAVKEIQIQIQRNNRLKTSSFQAVVKKRKLKKPIENKEFSSGLMKERALARQLVNCHGQSPLRKFKDRSFFYKWKPNPPIKKNS